MYIWGMYINNTSVHSLVNLLLQGISAKNSDLYVCAWVLNRAQLFVTPWSVAWQAHLSMIFSKEYWRWLPFPPPGDLLDPGMEPASPKSSAIAVRFFYYWAIWEARTQKGRGKTIFPPLQNYYLWAKITVRRRKILEFPYIDLFRTAKNGALMWNIHNLRVHSPPPKRGSNITGSQELKTNNTKILGKKKRNFKKSCIKKLWEFPTIAP